MAGIGKAGLVQHRLVDGRGDHRRRLARQAGLRGDLDGFDHGGGVGDIGLAGRGLDLGLGGDHGCAMTRENTGVAHQLERDGCRSCRPVGRKRQGDFRADAGQVRPW